MARVGASFVLVFVFVMMLGVVVSRVRGDKCGDEIQGLATNCAPILQGNAPSAACCGLIRSADMSCVCPKVTPAIAASINVPKLVTIIQSCGRNVPHQTRCGSIVTP
ncbi:hypothetical protein SUGI_0662030 [Cryptomeria japonica]|uniref:non-specific lipid-transfer protein 2 n=1 Tax=Cryptomeria japonica TaxID=3369 RepID=UPI002414C2E0|nr:non-specific lipid-transfer protein 2 [Cryptomeria japonica]GLJ32871.1 hypothetical protein SUGI_0662030 [Cryptomeria japonica]